MPVPLTTLMLLPVPVAVAPAVVIAQEEETRDARSSSVELALEAIRLIGAVLMQFPCSDVTKDARLSTAARASEAVREPLVLRVIVVCAPSTVASK